MLMLNNATDRLPPPPPAESPAPLAVLSPGTYARGTVIDRADFLRAVAAALPAGVVWRWRRRLGQVVRGGFDPYRVDYLPVILEAHIAFYRPGRTAGERGKPERCCCSVMWCGWLRRAALAGQIASVLEYRP